MAIPALLAPIMRMIVSDLVREVSAEARGLNMDLRVELDLANLRKLRGEQRKAIYRAIQRAAKPVREAVISQATKIKRFGHLAKSIGTKTKIKKAGIYTVVGPKMSFKRKKQGKKIGTIRGDQGRDNRGRFTAVTSFDVRHKTREFVPYRYAWILEYGLGGRFKFLEPAMKKAGRKFKDGVVWEIAKELKKIGAGKE